MKQIIKYYVLIVIPCLSLSSCEIQKRVYRKNYIFKYVNNQPARKTDPKKNDQLKIYEINKATPSKIDDKTDYLIIKNTAVLTNSTEVKSIDITPPNLEKIKLNGAIYSTESSIPIDDIYQKSFIYDDTKLAFQTFTIPIKFRKALDDGTKYPAQVETGVNIGFAPVIKHTFNVFDPFKKVMGKNLNQYSINAGLLLNLGATDLKTTSNAPGLMSDRRSATFTKGGFLLFGVNNINFGYAIGWDSIIGEGRSYWVYQNKMWHGIVIALDVIK